MTSKVSVSSESIERLILFGKPSDKLTSKVSIAYPPTPRLTVMVSSPQPETNSFMYIAPEISDWKNPGKVNVSPTLKTSYLSSFLTNRSLHSKPTSLYVFGSL